MMKKVLLLGDSIRMGYDSIVKKLLKGECEVYYDDLDNGRFTSYTLWQANQLFAKYGRFDVVHWNNGYWDMNTEAPMKEPISTISEYQYMLRRIVKLCKENSEHIIFATTLPVPSPDAVRSYDNDTVIAYNRAAYEVMKEENIAVNDLYARIYKEPNFAKCSDRIHLTEEGYQICAEQIVRKIRQTICSEPSTDNSSLL